MNENPVIKLRCDLLNGNFELDKETVAFMRFAREELSRAANAICAAQPQNADIGRMIAFLDKLQDAKDTVCAAAIIGDESAKRAESTKLAENAKRSKSAESSNSVAFGRRAKLRKRTQTSQSAEQSRATVSDQLLLRASRPVTQISFPQSLPNAWLVKKDDDDESK